MTQPARPHFVKRLQLYQFSVTLTEAQADRLERLRIRGGHRSWNAVIVALIAAGAVVDTTGGEVVMPGPVSDSSKGPRNTVPYVPSWCYPNGPKVCQCGHHEGYHNDAGACLLARQCGCQGIPPERVTPLDESKPDVFDAPREQEPAK